MPKIIKDAEEKILDAAMELFGEYGYQEVDMKMIAEKVGIAVGTLYNYYPNKKQLFISVFEKSWQNTASKLNEVINKDFSPKQKLSMFLETLYDEFSTRKGLGSALFKEKVIDEENIEIVFSIKEDISTKIEGLIQKVKDEEGFKFGDGMESRLAETFFILLMVIRNQHPEEKETNMQFINQFIECTFGNL